MADDPETLLLIKTQATRVETLARILDLIRSGSLAPQELVPEVEATIAKKYPPASGLEATVYICQASAGAGQF